MVDATLNSGPTPIARQRSAADALGLWEPKRTLTLEAAHRHTTRIRFIRRALLVAALALCALLVYFFATQGTQTRFVDDPETSVRMVKPRYAGRTADGLPFYLTSDTATRQLENRNEVLLDMPVLEFIRADGAESSFVEALEGTYDDVNKVLDIRKDVVLETDDGYRCRTTQARIFAREKRIEGDEPISCVGNFGTVNGNAFEVNDNYRTFVFKDGMTSLIKQDPAGAETETTGDAPFAFGGDGPIAVTADRGVYNGGQTDLTRNVVVEQDGATVYSQTMRIERERVENAAAGSLKLGPITRIDAKDDFRYVTEDNDVTGDRGIYERAKTRITVIGNVGVLQPGGNTVKTDRLVYDTKTETIRFSNQCQGRDCGENGRTRITIQNR